MSAERPTRSQCETCGGTGRVRSGDDRDWTTCPDCAPDGKTSDLTGLTGAIGWGLDPTGSTQDPLLGTKIHDVTIVRVIADGGMGRVYEALQDKPSQPVAVKIIRPGSASREAINRFEREAELLGSLDHEYIPRIYRAGLHDCDGGRVPYFVMQYIADALPLTAYADQHGKSPSERLELFRKVCDAVAYGHAMKPRSVVHRDLKPSNILVNRRGNPKVIDFGIARCIDTAPSVDTGLTTAGQVLGSVQYMSPEQFRGDPSAIDSRSDIWSLGVILHELMAGKPPYDVRGLNGFEAAHVVWQFRPSWSEDLMASLGPELLGIIEKCLRQDRDERFADAGELLIALATLPAEKPSLPLPPSQPSVATPPTAIRLGFNRRNALLAGGAVAAVGAAVLFRDVIPWNASEYPFTFNGRRYAIVFIPVTRAEAVVEAGRRGKSLARIDTTAQRKAVVKAASKAHGGPVYLWVDSRITGGGTDGGFPVISIVPPTYECVRLDGSTVAGGFVCDLGD